MIFGDNTLRQMARAYPTHIDALRVIGGMGETRRFRRHLQKRSRRLTVDLSESRVRRTRGVALRGGGGKHARHSRYCFRPTRRRREKPRSVRTLNHRR
ncbi:MAG: HRDC domain-containing protein [Verrucomicrobia bacterium]|nr:HRDC domain-containing protein [Verrucomicrobiota bacterium]